MSPALPRGRPAASDELCTLQPTHYSLIISIELYLKRSRLSQFIAFACIYAFSYSFAVCRVTQLMVFQITNKDYINTQICVLQHKRLMLLILHATGGLWERLTSSSGHHYYNSSFSSSQPIYAPTSPLSMRGLGLAHFNHAGPVRLSQLLLFNKES